MDRLDFKGGFKKDWEDPGLALNFADRIYGRQVSQMSLDLVDNSERLERRCKTGATVASPMTRTERRPWKCA
jgi:hypothetical protein